MIKAYEQVEDRDKFIQDFQKKSTSEITKDEPKMNM